MRDQPKSSGFPKRHSSSGEGPHLNINSSLNPNLFEFTCWELTFPCCKTETKTGSCVMKVLETHSRPFLCHFSSLSLCTYAVRLLESLSSKQAVVGKNWLERPLQKSVFFFLATEAAPQQLTSAKVSLVQFDIFPPPGHDCTVSMPACQLVYCSLSCHCQVDPQWWYGLWLWVRTWVA